MSLRRVVVVAAVLLAACGGGDSRVVVAAGTTLVDSGVLDALAAQYEADHPGVELSIVPRPTAEVLDLGERGAADVLITHAPQQEQAFLDSHPDAAAWPIFNSRFLLLAPPASAARLGGRSVTDAFRSIAETGHPFVTRMDGSGTYDAERRIWADVPLQPDGTDWYAATGSGMGFSLQVADQTGSAILAEQGSVIAADPVIDLVAVTLVDAAGPLLINPYTAIVVASSPPEGEEFVTWLVSPAGREALARANAELFGEAVFVP
jgi:tungstate transport system substrate-binding protein